MPVRLLELVAGKFLSALALVALALALTLFLPITVASLGNLDWGPVIGGYLAALLLASSYIAIGLFLSSRTNNQLVALDRHCLRLRLVSSHRLAGRSPICSAPQPATSCDNSARAAASKASSAAWSTFAI